MIGATFDYARKHSKSLSSKTEIIIAPPFIYLSEAIKVSAGKPLFCHIGAQNCFWLQEGAFTGEISPLMLKNMGVQWVIIGHSERRAYAGENDAIVAAKIKAAFQAGLSVVLCVGEPEEIQQKGMQATKDFIENQLRIALAGIKEFKHSDSILVLAYEPVWTIGSGTADNPQDASEIAVFIKKLLNEELMLQNVKVLYGGSTTAKNAKQFLQLDVIDGLLVGGASLNIDEFEAIINQTF